MTGPIWFMKRTRLRKRRACRALEAFINYNIEPCPHVCLRYGRWHDQVEEIKEYGIGVIDLGAELEKA